MTYTQAESIDVNKLPVVQAAVILPIGLPSLRIAYVTLPALPMSEGEYDHLLKVLTDCRAAATESKEEQPSG